jgi:hypothetical protein
MSRLSHNQISMRAPSRPACAHSWADRATGYFEMRLSEVDGESRDRSTPCSFASVARRELRALDGRMSHKVLYYVAKRCCARNRLRRKGASYECVSDRVSLFAHAHRVRRRGSAVNEGAPRRALDDCPRRPFETPLSGGLERCARGCRAAHRSRASIGLAGRTLRLGIVPA